MRLDPSGPIQVGGLGFDVATQAELDAKKLDGLAVPTDVATLNADTSKHGLLRKLDGLAYHFLDGNGGWSSPADRQQIARTARGFISENAPEQMCMSTAIPTAGTTNGTLVLAALGLRKDDVITNLVVKSSAIGVSLTLVKLGLFDKNGVFLKATASAHATFNATAGFKVVALTGGTYTVPSDDLYYIGFLQFGSGATGATLYRTGSALAGSGVLNGAFPRSHALVATQTDISADVTLADSTQCFWAGCS